MLKYAILPLSHWRDTKGRSSRQEFIGFMAAWGVFALASLLILAALPIDLFGDSSSLDNAPDWAIGIYLAWLLIILASFVPMVTLVIRRFRDLERSPWMTLLVFVPLGGVVILYFMMLPGTAGANRFGPDPLVS